MNNLTTKTLLHCIVQHALSHYRALNLKAIVEKNDISYTNDDIKETDRICRTTCIALTCNAPPMFNVRTRSTLRVILQRPQ